MVQPTPLHYVNGGEPTVKECANCGVLLGDYRALARTNAGIKFFCKLEPSDDPSNACYTQWARKNPRLIRRIH